MKYFQWTIGSTTVRNPDRLRDGLRILKDNFEGKEWNTSQQENFFNLLRKHKIYEIDDTNYDRMIPSRKQQHARKWVSVLNQLGFCFAYESSKELVKITEAGNSLLNNPDIEDEVFLRQLLKYQKPCSLPKQNGAVFKNVSVLPFIVSLKMTHELNGLSKEEISIFLNTTIQMDNIDNTIEQIKHYRDNRGKIEGKVKRKQFYVKTQLIKLKDVFSDEIKERIELIKELRLGYKKSSAFLSSKEGKALLAAITKGGKGSKTTRAKKAQLDIVKIIKAGKDTTEARKVFLNYYLSLKIETLSDYSDLTSRYLRKSGLFSVSREKLVTIAEKEDLIQSILAKKWPLVEDEKYLNYLWDGSLPTLPSDDASYLKKHLKIIIEKEKVLSNKVRKGEALSLVGETFELAEKVNELKQQTKMVETNVLNLKEVEFYYNQSESEQIDDITNFYELILTKQIFGGEAYYPAYLEWNTWRVFLAIDTLTNKPYEARNFKLDDELQPISHAPGNRADMVFEYNNFILVIEVTLNVGSNQYNTEAEPVPRHVARVQANNSKDVYGLFIAPKIDKNTVLTFFNNRKYWVEEIKKIIELTIIPLSVNQVKQLLGIFKQKKFSTKNMKLLFDEIKEEIPNSNNDAVEWYEKIPGIINRWEQNL